MRINTNMNAMTALNQSTKNTALAGNSMAKLSSGLRINKAGDDAAGLAISEKMRAQIRGMEQAEKNTQDGISAIQTAEGGMEEIGNIVQRMRELAVQSSNETNSGEDREKISTELKQLHEEVDRIAKSTEFNGKSLLDAKGGVKTPGTNATVNGGAGVTISGATGAFEGITTIHTESKINGDIIVTLNKGVDGEVTKTVNATADATDVEFDFGALGKFKAQVADTTSAQAEAAGTITAGTADVIEEVELAIDLQIGANNKDGQGLKVNIANVTTAALGLNISDVDLSGKQADGTYDIDAGTTASNELIAKLDSALETVNTSRASLGAYQNRLESAQSNLTTSNENLTAAESRIRDVDVAKEMMNLSKLNLLNQASQAMMTQAKSQPEGVMQLLR